MEKSPKLKNVLNIVKTKAKQGHFIILPHAIERQDQRKISVPDIVHVLTTGWHEAKKDSYNEQFNAWNYAIMGKTIEERKLRIITSFDENNMLIITVININRGQNE